MTNATDLNVQPVSSAGHYWCPYLKVHVYVHTESNLLFKKIINVGGKHYST